jgi:putative tryptophan/tyrosine transport system substrate-binding protein
MWPARRSPAMLLVALALGLLVAPLAAAVQPPPKVARIGVLTPGSPGPSPSLEAFRRGLHELGYVEGRNLAIEWRFAEGGLHQLPDFAAEFVRLKVDVIFAINTPAALAAKNATSTIPIVITRISDPVRVGLIASLARPGGNITGVSTISPELGAKRLELIRALLSEVSRVALLWNSANTGHALIVREIEEAGPPLGVQVQVLGVQGPSPDFESAFEAAIRGQAGALFVIDDLMISSHQTRILEWAAKNRLPVFSQFREFAEAGGLMAYGPNNDEMFRRVAFFIDKILRGAKPADLPVEQPTAFELVINLKTADALGLMITPTFLFQANEVIR